MALDKNDTYELWNLEPPFVSKHSHLFHLKPIGVGTANVESLTSYIARLAEAHSITVGRLVCAEIAPSLKESYIFNPKYSDMSRVCSSAFTKSLNGQCLTAATVVEVLENLTQRNDLHFLTMLTWTDVISQKYLLHPKKAWCPFCYQERFEAKQVVYEPLIWALNVVEICPHHHCRLHTQCPYCYKQLPLLSGNYRSGYCSRCQSWLGLSSELKTFKNSQFLSEEELELQLKVLDNVGELLAIAPDILFYPPSDNIKNVISVYINQLTKGDLSEFAQLLGLSPHSLNKWYRGKAIPELNKLLEICFYLQTPLVDFLMAIEVSAASNDIPIQPQTPKKRSTQTLCSNPSLLEEVEQVLLAALEESPPRSLYQVVKNLKNITRSSVRRYFPNLCCQISERYSASRKPNHQKIRQVLLSVVNNGEYPPPSVVVIAKRIGIWRKTLYKEFPDLCEKISEQHSCYIKLRQLERIEKIKQEVRQAVLKLHNKGIKPHSRYVSELLIKPGLMHDKNAIAAFHEVRRELGYE
ncbi:MAG: TniQ family protein [Nostoc sp.]|uniref:TniQ family protein n=1 Tax=Nostoc sp. TaxID=1180 RepID=UPI002FF82808